MKITLACILFIGAMNSLSVRAELLDGTPDSASVSGRVSVGEYGLGGAFPVLQARPFSTGDQEYDLDSIFFGSRLYLDSGPGEITVSVYNNSGTVPGSAVAGGLNLFSATSGTINQVLTPSSTITLNANSTYWFVAAVDQAGGATRYWWDLTDSEAFDSDVSGTGMELTAANDANGWAGFNGESMHMSINGTAVPEPGTLPLLGLAAGGVWLARKKRMTRIHKKRPEFEEVVYHLSFLEEERQDAPLGNTFLI